MALHTFRRLINFAFVIATLSLLSTAAFAQNYPIGNSHLSDMKPGSVLFFNRYSSNPSNPQMGDTQINITNVNQNTEVDIHLFLVDGGSCSIADSFIGLTPNQTASFLVSDYDPGITGYIVAVAVNGGGPTQFNHLIGTEFIRETDGKAGYLQAVSIAKTVAGEALPDGTGVTNLIFDGKTTGPGGENSYERLPMSLGLSTFNSQTTDSTALSIYSPSSNLITGSVNTVSIFTLLYNDVEVALSSSFTVRCYRYETLTALFNRGGGINRHVPAGRTGWIRMTASGSPILGAVLGKGNVFTGAHNLHALSLLSTYSITVPVF
ncbi:MAG TPA: hypothetical protein PLQ88_24255 [Blastocatellia bacterium]|nr:hypothetical protein [Blastocatellia bacterium]